MLQSLKSPFFGSLITSPSLQSAGTFSSSQILANRLCSISVAVSISASRASAGIPSGPAALPFFKVLIAFFISSLDGFSTLIGKSTSACEILGCSSGVGRLSKSVKCSTHWFSCCSVVISIWPSLFLIGMFDCWNFPLSFLVSTYRSLRFPCPAASSAWLANSSTKLFLSFLTFAFTSLSAAAYSFCAFVFAFLVRLKLRMFFFSLSLPLFSG